MIPRTTVASSCFAMSIMVALLLPSARAGRDVRITYEDNGSVETRNFDLLVVACDPAALADVFDGRTEVEERVEAALERYTLGTSLWDVRRMDGEGSLYSMRISPDQLSASDGKVYAIRDEPRTRTARTRPHTLVTAYQFTNSSVSEDEVMSKASAAMSGINREDDWMGLEPERTLLEVETSSNYFPHFSQEGLEEGLPWAVLDAQGEHDTIYVSSFGSFESVLAVYEYGNMLENTTQVQDAFEKARHASTKPRVAVIGAGPSGILFASQQLKRAGLDDITIYEKEPEWGGKTSTYYYKAPGYPNKKKVPVELGTCYLANTYKAFAEMLEAEYGIEKPVRLSYGEDDPGPRGMFDAASEAFIPYGLWTLEAPDGTQISPDEFSVALGTYLAAHYSLAGWSMDTGVPIPPSQPEDLPSMTFLEYLENLGIGVLKNFFTYAYSAQGYGDINDIPAYYGLIWIMPDVFTEQLEVAASVTEQMAEAAEDADSRRLLVDNASAMRQGSKVAKRFKKSAAEEFERGVRPSFEQTSDLATRCHEHVLAEIDGDEEEEEGDSEDDESLDGVYLIQEGYGYVWDKIIHQESLRSKIKLGVNVLKIERRGLGSY